MRSLPSDSILHDIRDAWEDEAGRIWILSGYAPYLHVYGEDGRQVRSFGARGEGPGELRASWYLVGASRRPASFPDGFQPLHFGEKRIVGISTDSLGVQVPALVPFPEELMRR